MNNQELEGHRKFDVAIIISLTSGRLYCDLDNLKELNIFLSSYYPDKRHLDHEMMRNFIYHFYPDLKGVGKNEVFNSQEEIDAFVNGQRLRFGYELPLRPIFGSDKELLEPSSNERNV